ncbi:MAG TPA: ATP-dependent helicase [Ilumatobacter sp.]|nr:ATP-dependent helicase [Ilumatobacter sp.]
MDADALLAGLDEDQRRAVTTDSQLVAVVAGAGSGKTRVLTRRVAYRVVTGTAEEPHTLVLTFTREAAGELRRRLPRLGLAGRVTAGTFHAVAHGMLQQRWRDSDQRPRAVASDRTRALTRLAPPGVDVQLLSDAVGWATARRLSPAAYESAARRGEHRSPIAPQVVAQTLEAYRRDKQSRAVVDLDDLLVLTLDALERDADYAEAQRWRFRHILVDEAQDLNPLQHRLLDLLRAGRDDLYLVGDAAQAIYGFNGSDPALLIDVEHRFPGVEVVRLPANYRCTPQIVAAGVHVLARSEQPANLRSARPDGSVVRVAAHSDEHVEAAAVARTIARLDPSLVRGSHVAVLARTNAQLQPIARALGTVGVGVREAVHGAGSPLRPVVAQVYRLGDGPQLRTWAQDALESADDSAEPDDSPQRVVARVVLDFLRAHPIGDGPAFRAWVDATDPFGESTQGVELLTFHGAKGREWHTVLLVGCETSLVPHRSATTNAARAEEARLLYVAVTRATDVLIVNWAQRRGGYRRRVTPLLEGFVSATAEVVPPPRELVAAPRTERDLALDRLTAWRADAARAAGILPQEVCPDAVLSAIVDHPPADAGGLDALTGMGVLTSRRLFPGIAAALQTVSS